MTTACRYRLSAARIARTIHAVAVVDSSVALAFTCSHRSSDRRTCRTFVTPMSGAPDASPGVGAVPGPLAAVGDATEGLRAREVTARFGGVGLGSHVGDHLGGALADSVCLRLRHRRHGRHCTHTVPTAQGETR